MKKGFFLKGVDVFETRDQALQHTENTPILQTHAGMDSCVYEGFIHTPVACTSSRKSAGIPGTALFRPKIPSGEWTRAIITGGVGNKAGGEHIIGGGGIEAGGEHIIGRGGGIGSCSTHAHV